MDNLTSNLTEDQLKQNIDALVKQQAPHDIIQSYIDKYQKNSSGGYVLKGYPAPTTPQKSFGEKLGNTLGDVFGGKIIGEAIGNTAAKNKFEKDYAGLKISNPKAYQQIVESTFKSPTGGQIAADFGRVASNFIPAGEIAGGVAKGLKAVPLIGKVAKPIANIATGAGVGAAVQGLQQASEGQKVDVGTGALLGGAIPAIGPLARTGGKAAREVLGLTTGEGSGAIKELLNSSRAGGVRAIAAQQAMRGKIPQSEIVDEAKNALDTLVNTRRNNYTQSVEKLKGATQSLDVSPVHKKLQQNLEKFNIKNNVDGTLDFSRSSIRFNKEAQQDIQNIVDTLKDYGTKPGDNTVLGVDSLKQAFGDLYSESSKARAFVASMTDEVRKIAKQVPGYAEMEAKYAEESGLIKDVQKSLSLGDRASAETAFRKLSKIFKGNNEIRKQLVDELDAVGGTNLKSKIAGQQFNELTPGFIRGLGGVAAGYGGSTIGGGSILPVLAGIASFSPRVVGEATNLLGLSLRQKDKLEKILFGVGANKAVTPGDVLLNKVRGGLPKKPAKLK